jgi:hypothetical protein
MRNPLPACLSTLAIMAIVGCSEDCPEAVGACQHIPPTDEACLAYFRRWFFDVESNGCTQTGYSGCNVYGFATEAECTECACQ